MFAKSKVGAKSGKLHILNQFKDYEVYFFISTNDGTIPIEVNAN